MSLLITDLPDGARRTRRAGLAAIEATGDAATVLLVPGLTGSKEDFAPMLPTLTGLHVVAIDQRGQYESPDDPDAAAFTIPALARDLLAVAAELGGPVHLVGHSFGGLVAREAVLHDRAPWASLTLMGSGPGALGGGRAAVLDAVRPILASSGLTGVVAAQDAMNAADPTRVPQPPVVETFFRHRMLTGSPLALQVMADELLVAPDRVGELSGVDLPMLVLHGQDDDAWPPAEQQEMAHRLGAGYVVIDGARHSPAAERPEQTARALRAFWDQSSVQRLSKET